MNPSAITLPNGACDCHVHLFGPSTYYPFADERIYTPGDADEAALNALHARLGIARVVLVQPSVYGTDNRRLCDGLQRLGERARAVAVIADDCDEATLRMLHRLGVRGVRVNLSTFGISDPDAAWTRIEAQAARIAGLGWHVQALVKASVVARLADRIARLPCPLVLDHFGQPDLARGAADADFRTIVDGLRAGHIHVKLSAMQRRTGAGRLALLQPFIAALADANPRGLLWGTDWPHTGGGRGLGHETARLVTDI
ncbi:MAG: amidohydrolase family protein, partial [Beijerinckiaceae bacterium]